MVVRPVVEAGDPAVETVAGGEDRHGRVVAGHAGGPQQFEAVGARQAEVEQGEDMSADA